MVKHLLIISFVLLMIGCSDSPPKNSMSTENKDIKFSRLKSKDIFKIMVTVDEKTRKPIKSDTVPHSIKFILNYKKTHKQLDTTHGINAVKALDLAKSEITLKRDTCVLNECEPLKISLIDDAYWYITGANKKFTFGDRPEIIVLRTNGQIIFYRINQ